MSALRNLSSRLKVGTRVAIGFASILVLLGVVAGVGYYGLSTSDYNVKRFDRDSHAYASVAKMENAFEQMRRSVILYGQSGAPELEKEARKFQALTEKHAADARVKIPAADRLQMLDQVVGILGQYGKNLDLVAKALNAKQEHNKVQRTVGGRLQSVLGELARSSIEKKDIAVIELVSKAQLSLDTARLNINRYFTAPDPSVAKAVLDNINRVPGLLKQIREAVTAPEDQKRADEAIATALVEENAATGKTLEHQAHAMDERVAFFRIAVSAEPAQAASSVANKRPAAMPPSRGPAAAKAQPAMAKRKPVAAPQRAAAGHRSGGPVGRMQAQLATAVNELAD